jgi:preprotein translocase subunit SecA
MQQLTDDELAAYTTKFRARLASGESLQSLLPEAFAVVREAASRVLGMRHYDVQILGGIVLAQGQVAEMATGEGKTLVAALPAYLYALSGKGVHIVTVNDYLAQRDASWIGKILTFLGLHVGVVTSEASDSQRAVGFAADVTYITAYELAFTFLQDNLAPSTDAVVRSLFNDY